jgi:hypothetical protein
METIAAPVGHIKKSISLCKQNKSKILFNDKVITDRVLKKHFHDCLGNVKRSETRDNILNRLKKGWHDVYLPVTLECVYKQESGMQSKEFARVFLAGKPWASFEIPAYEWSIMKDNYEILLDRN